MLERPRASRFTPPALTGPGGLEPISLAMAKDRIGLPQTYATEDAYIEEAAHRSVGVVEEILGYPLRPALVIDEFHYRGSGSYLLSAPPNTVESGTATLQPQGTELTVEFYHYGERGLATISGDSPSVTGPGVSVPPRVLVAYTTRPNLAPVPIVNAILWETNRIYRTRDETDPEVARRVPRALFTMVEPYVRYDQ